MGVFENFPYTNFHRTNLDWLLTEMKKLIAEWADLKVQFEDLDTAFADLKSYVENYFANLDLSVEVTTILQQMLDNGDLDPIINAKVSQDLPGIVTTWLNDNVTPVGGAVTVDASLSIAGSAADALETGKIYKNLVKNISGAEVLLDIPNYTPGNLSYAGITATWNAVTQSYTINGTATAAISFNIYVQSSPLPEGVNVGDTLLFTYSSTNANVKAGIALYKSGAWSGPYFQSRYFAQIDSNTTGFLIRLAIPSGTVCNSETLTFSLTKQVSSAELARNCIYIPGDQGVDESGRINNALMSAPVVILGAGTHRIDYAITMPSGTSLVGIGKDATILKQTVAATDAIQITGERCAVRDMTIEGGSATTPSSPSGGSGVHVDGSNGDIFETVIENCYINHFSYAGVRLNNQSYWCANSCTVSNVTCRYCHAGIFTEANSEYSRISDCMCYGCYVGARNDGGNNVFTNCTFSNNTVGFYITQNATVNDGHGSAIGCTFNHSANNTGFGIILNDVTNGFQFVGCHAWYSKVYVENSTGISFDGCVFSNADNPDVTVMSSTGTIFADCRFKTTPVFSGTHPTMVNCYKFDGTAVL